MTKWMPLFVVLAGCASHPSMDSAEEGSRVPASLSSHAASFVDSMMGEYKFAGATPKASCHSMGKIKKDDRIHLISKLKEETDFRGPKGATNIYVERFSHHEWVAIKGIHDFVAANEGAVREFVPERDIAQEPYVHQYTKTIVDPSQHMITQITSYRAPANDSDYFVQSMVFSEGEHMRFEFRESSGAPYDVCEFTRVKDFHFATH